MDNNNGYYENQSNNQNNQQMYSQQTPNNQQMYNQQMYNQQMYNTNMQAQPMSSNAPDYILWLILGIIQIVFICCCNCFSFITGILTVVFVIMANSSYKAGNMQDYMSKIKTAKIINIIGWVLMVLNWVLAIFGGLFEAIANGLA